MPQVSSYAAASGVTDDDTLYLIDGATSKKVTAATLKTYAQAGLSVDPTVGGDLSGTASNAQIVANAVGTTELANSSVTAAKVAADVATQAELDAHVNDTTDAHAASAISFSPTGTIAATTVQAAIAEVASEGGGGGSGPDETYQDHGAAGTTETLSYSTARTHRILLDSSSCALSFSGWPASGSKGAIELIVDHGTTTTARTVTYPAGSKFPSGVQPPLPTTTASAIWRYVITTWDGGTTTYWDLIGADYS